MISEVNSFEQHVGARLLDFFDSRSPWHRGLWNVGTALMLLEVLEAAEAVQAGVLSDAAFGFLANSAQKTLGLDTGAGSIERRQVLQRALKAKPNLHDLDYHIIATQLPEIRNAYLKCWSEALALADPAQLLRPERTARAIASHLLDLGFSSDFLHRWWKYHLNHQEGTRSLSEIVSDAHTLAQSKPREFEVLVAFEAALHSRAEKPEGLIDAQQVSNWLASNGFDGRGVRQDGGLILRLSALDSGVAAQRAGELLDRLRLRVAVGTRSHFRAHRQLWVKGETAGQRIDQTQRGVAVRALEREKQVYYFGQPNVLDAALELLSHLQISTPSAAVAGGWAAIEALLSEPSDRAIAADRLAMLVACSFPRAELTVLSYSLERLGGEIGSQLRAINTNRERAAFVLRILTGTVPEESLRISDRVAIARMRNLITSPRKILADVQEHAAGVFRRLYRQRNLVLHWGKMDAVALRASLRTAAPLVGAGIDRIVHAHYVDGLKPLEITARAQIALATVGSGAGPSCVDLLM